MKRRVALIAICILALIGLGAFVMHHRHQPAASHAVGINKPTSQTTTPQPATAPATTNFNKSQYSLTDPASIWVVVNKHRPLSPLDYAPADLTSVGNGQQMRAAAATALSDMFMAAKKAGYTLSAASAYRSYTTQVSVYNKEVADYGKARADSESARPGFSEHQTGLSVDIAGGGCSIEDCFGTTAEGKWTTIHAYEYGYILRYTSDKTPITGYRAEAWHFRYVGKDLARQMHDSGVSTLEEYFDLGAAPDYN
jgi:D-alanyl-D-alanine carboxypeptidase